MTTQELGINNSHKNSRTQYVIIGFVLVHVCCRKAGKNQSKRRTNTKISMDTTDECRKPAERTKQLSGIILENYSESPQFFSDKNSIR